MGRGLHRYDSACNSGGSRDPRGDVSDASATGVRCSFPGPPLRQSFWDFALPSRPSGDSDAGGTWEVQVKAPKLGLVTCASTTRVLRDGRKVQPQKRQEGADETFAFSACKKKKT